MFPNNLYIYKGAKLKALEGPVEMVVNIVGDVERVSGKDLSYDEFAEKYLSKTSRWLSRD